MDIVMYGLGMNKHMEEDGANSYKEITSLSTDFDSSITTLSNKIHDLFMKAMVNILNIIKDSTFDIPKNIPNRDLDNWLYIEFYVKDCGLTYAINKDGSVGFIVNSDKKLDNNNPIIEELTETVIVDVNNYGFPVTKYKTYLPEEIWEIAAIFNKLNLVGIEDEKTSFPVKVSRSHHADGLAVVFNTDNGMNMISNFDMRIPKEDLNKLNPNADGIRTALKAFGAACAYTGVKNIFVFNAEITEFIADLSYKSDDGGEIKPWFKKDRYGIPPITFFTVMEDDKNENNT